MFFTKTKKILKPEIIFISIFLIAFIVYFSTMLPGVGFWDTGEFQTILYTFDIAHPTGYPTYLILGKLFTSIFPFGSIAWRVNLLSVLFSSFGIYLLALSIYRLTKNYFLSFASTFFMSTNPYLWSISTSADPHSLHFLFFSVIFYLIILIFVTRKLGYLPLLGFILGISLGNHLLSLFFIPPIVILLFLKRKNFSSKLLVKSLLLFLAGLSVYLIILLLGKLKPPLVISYGVTNLKVFFKHVSGGDFKPMMHGWTRGSFNETFLYFSSISQNFFGLPLLMLSLVGILLTFLFQKQVGLFIFFSYLGILGFSLRYQNGFLERYFVVPFALMTISLILIPKIVEKLSPKIVKKKLKFVFSFFGIILAGTLLLQGTINLLRFYPQQDKGKNTSAKIFADRFFDSAPNNSVIFSWWSYSTPLWYEQKVEGKRPDIKIVNANQSDWEKEALKYVHTNPIYFLEKISISNPNYILVPEKNLFRYQTK